MFEVWRYINVYNQKCRYVKEFAGGRQVAISKRRWKKFLQSHWSN